MNDMYDFSIKREQFFKRWGYNLCGVHKINIDPFSPCDNTDGNNNSPFALTIYTGISLYDAKITMTIETRGDELHYDKEMPIKGIKGFVDEIVDKYYQYVRQGDTEFSMEDMEYSLSYIKRYLTNNIELEFMLADRVLEDMKKSPLFKNVFEQRNANILKEKQMYIKKLWKLIDDASPETDLIDCEELTNGEGLKLNLTLWGEEREHKIMDFYIPDLPAVAGQITINVYVESVVDGESFNDDMQNFNFDEVKRMYNAVVELLANNKK